jgi:hypothetical protein
MTEDWSSSPGRAKNFLQAQTGPGIHTASYPMGIKGSLLEGKAAGREADNNQCEVETFDSIHTLPHASS